MKILVSQNAPSNTAQYEALKNKFGAEIEFKPFFTIQPLSSRDFRTQHINFADYTAVVFSSRYAIDAYFKLCEELRFSVPETMKYFCTTEIVALYLQKHIVFRKRKIFSGNGTAESIISLIGPKHAGEKFLITTSDTANAGHVSHLFESKGLDFTVACLVESVPNNLKDVDFSQYGMMVMYNPSDVKALYANFPEFKQGDLKILAYGKNIVKSLEDAGLQVAMTGPTPEAPSVAKALELYLSR